MLLAAALSACATRQATLRAATAVTLPDEVQSLVRRALTLDAAADRSADTLYAPEALVVANARARLTAPRFAGVGPGGQVTIAGATVTLEGRFAWATVDYRWVNTPQRLAEAGRASFVCELRGSSWKIVHAHSSQLLPWER
jgi:SnoaL-like protein